MNASKLVLKAWLAGLLAMLAGRMLWAQSNPVYISFSTGANAALYRPDGNPSPQVGLLLVHRVSNFMNHLGCTELSKRGFAVLCMNTRFENNESLVNWEKLPLDVRQGVEYLKNTQKVAKVVLFGHSGGGATTTFYQAVAENGPAYCQGANKLSQCDNSLAGLPKTDGIVIVDAHPAIAVNALRAMNPAVFNEQRPDLVRSDLDPFNPANGYNPSGVSHYSAEFQKRYTEAQAKRMNEWIDRALYIRDLIKAGKWIYPDDDSIIIPRAADRVTNIFSLDTSILCCTKKPQKLLKNDGSVVTQIIKSVRPPDPTLAKTNGSYAGGARILTITSFLSANAIRATDSLDYSKIDWCSTNNSVPCALRSITAPVLITAMGAHYFISDSEFFLEQAKSADKEYIVVEGAVHGITPCKECAGGPYDNSVKNFFDYVAKWINTRFGPRG
jgi:pimeloyl-ACP methyl ester carboxylesterase